MAHEVYKRRAKWKGALHFASGLIFSLCYAIGLALLKISKFFWPGGKLHRSIQYKLDNWQVLRPGSTLALFILLALVVILSFPVANLIVQGQHLMGKVLGSADTGLNHLSAAKTLLEQQDAAGANERLGLALQSFEQSRADLNSNNALLQNLLNLTPQKQDADDLLQATILLTQAGQDWTQFYQLSQTVTITPQGINSKEASGPVLQEMNQHLQTGRQKIDQALMLLAQVNPGILPAEKQQQFIEVTNNLSAIQAGVDSVGEVFDVLYAIISGQKQVLFLFENNNELRATGGFLGTFGAMDLHDGQIGNLRISSIYDLDGQLQENFAPPWPVLAVNPRWYLRDANWFTDFAASSQVISRFYEKEGEQTPDLIIALTPQLVVDILKIVGPITLPRYNVTFTPENFVATAQQESSVNYDKTLNQPKQILADFFPTLLQQLSSLPANKLILLVQALQRNLAQKQLLLYSRDAGLRQQLENFNWAGTIKDTDRDYLLISSSNLGGTKTDTAITQDVTLNSELQANGHIINTLSITRNNPLAEEDQYRNLSFLRIYVPLGSKLLSVQGFDQQNLARTLNPMQLVDPQLQECEKNVQIEQYTGTIIGKESGKTIFGNWSELRGGQTKTIILTYQLPFALQVLDHHSLLVQKQPGTGSEQLHYTMHFPDYVLQWTSNGQAGSEHTWQLDQTLREDWFAGLILQKP